MVMAQLWLAVLEAETVANLVWDGIAERLTAVGDERLVAVPSPNEPAGLLHQVRVGVGACCLFRVRA